MPTDIEPLVFLDTMVVAGIYAVSKSGPQKILDESKSEWKRAVISLLKSAGLKGQNLSISRPVLHELMSMNRQWYDYIKSHAVGGAKLFLLSNESIDSDILDIAAKYSYECRANLFQDKKDGKLKSLDPVIAAYAIKVNGFIVTENQRDYPESHFKILSSEPVVLSVKNSETERRVIFLLKVK